MHPLRAEKQRPGQKLGRFQLLARCDLASLSRHLVRRRAFSADYETLAYNRFMERKVFWMVFMALGLVADFLLPLWWGIAATIPIVFIAWWVAYRSDWF